MEQLIVNFKKELVVLRHNEGQLANQLWLYSNLLAYALEHNYRFDIWCFYEYSKMFRSPFPRNRIIRLLFYRTFPLFVLKNKNLFRVTRKAFRTIYRAIVMFPITTLYRPNVVKAVGNHVNLSNSNSLPKPLKHLENSDKYEKVFTVGWLFSYVEGLEKYRMQVAETFQPKKEIKEKVDKAVSELRKKYEFLIGLHLRQWEPGDGRPIHDEILVFGEDLSFITGLVKDFLEIRNIDASKTAIVICANDLIDTKPFFPLNVVCGKRNLVEDLFLLASMDIIFGCMSTFSLYAAYLGNIPFVFLYKSRQKWLEEIIKGDHHWLKSATLVMPPFQNI